MVRRKLKLQIKKILNGKRCNRKNSNRLLRTAGNKGELVEVLHSEQEEASGASDENQDLPRG